MSKLNREKVLEKMVGSLRADVTNMMTMNAEYKAIIELQNEELEELRKFKQEHEAAPELEVVGD